MRETVLAYLQQGNFDGITSILRNNSVFNSLLGDPIFKTVFFQNFTNELFKRQDLAITYPAFLLHCHDSKDYSFVLSQADEVRVLEFLVDTTQSYQYATRLPDYPASIVIIEEHRSNLALEATKAEQRAKKHSDFNIVEQYANNKTHLLKSIFNSPQEKEFFLACRKVFPEHIILPNVALTTVLNQEIIKEKFSEHIGFVLTASVDLVIVDPETFIPILFFELDSKAYHNGGRLSKDELKTMLLNELGKNLIRVTKKTGKEGTNEFIRLLASIKTEHQIQ